MRRYLLAALALLALALAGCAPLATPGPGQAPSTPLIEYRRTGGFAGFDDHLTVEATGQASLTRRQTTVTFSIDKAALEQLTATFDKAGFSGLKAEYLPTGKGADLFDYVVTYKGRSVHTQDTAVPEALQPVLAALNEIVSAQGK